MRADCSARSAARCLREETGGGGGGGSTVVADVSCESVVRAFIKMNDNVAVRNGLEIN